MKKYLEAWELSDPQPLAETPTSRVFTVTSQNRTLVFKFLTPEGALDESNGAVALRCFNGEGAVRLLRSDPQAQLLEYAEGPDLKSLVEKGEDEKATLIIADIINKLHRAYQGPIPAELTSLNVRFESLFQRATRDQNEKVSSIYTRAAQVARELLDAPANCCVLHGDMHHQNVRHSAQRGWLALDPKGLSGESTFDAANVLLNPVSMPALVENNARLTTTAVVLAQAMGIDLQRLFAFTYAFSALSAVWSVEDRLDPAPALRMAALLEPHLA